MQRALAVPMMTVLQVMRRAVVRLLMATVMVRVLQVMSWLMVPLMMLTVRVLLAL